MSAARVPAVQTAGALVWRVKKDKLQVQLIHRPRYDDWSWPKGKLEPGESRQAGAIREVQEETGKPIVLGQPLPSRRYKMPDGRWKTVHYWAARRAGTDASDSAALASRWPVAPVNPKEIDKHVWLDAHDAHKRLSRRSDRNLLAVLVETYEAGRLDTHAVVIARHGKAVPRTSWLGDENDRPLTPIGHAHAAAARPYLGSYGVRTVLTSQWERCASTIAPYLRATGITPYVSDYLTEASHERSPAQVAAAVRRMLEHPDSVVLCTHRPVLPTVIDVLAQHARRGVADLLPRKDPYLEPGELLVAHTAIGPKGPRVVAVEKISPTLY